MDVANIMLALVVDRCASLRPAVFMPVFRVQLVLCSSGGGSVATKVAWGNFSHNASRR